MELTNMKSDGTQKLLERLKTKEILGLYKEPFQVTAETSHKLSIKLVIMSGLKGKNGSVQFQPEKPGLPLKNN
ncbi:hypothetical protein [Bacillus sonorensis]|nr:hypothetical protein [Bacillus sonorensis]MCY8607250.1 hypothetical protein [Bacillus sonorensis]